MLSGLLLAPMTATEFGVKILSRLYMPTTVSFQRLYGGGVLFPSPVLSMSNPCARGYDPVIGHITYGDQEVYWVYAMERKKQFRSKIVELFYTV
mgnify:FL=1